MYLESLNKEQKEAATIIDGPELIIAGAGTGKTHTMTARVMHMVNSGIAPENILLLTFTNKAAREMKSRVIKEVGSGSEKITASTFHSFCAGILRQYGAYLNNLPVWKDIIGSYDFFGNLDNNYRILSSGEARDIMEIARNERLDEFNKSRVKSGLAKVKKSNYVSTNLLIDVWSTYTNENVVKGINLSNTIIQKLSSEKEFSVDFYEVEALAIVRQLVKYKISKNMLDYDDLLMVTWNVLSTNEAIRTSLDRHYKYVMSDEYQDTNTIQDRILDLLSKDNRNLCVCGDDNQSIYKFRGARIENILSFDKRYPDCKTVKLIQNYRSTQEILDVSNAMMDHAREGIPKKLIGQKHGDKPTLTVMANYDVTKTIVDEIEEAHKKGTPYKDFGILIRSGSQSAQLETAFNVANIPFEKFGGLKFLDHKVVRDILAYAIVLINPKDELGYLQIARQFSDLGAKRSKEFAEQISSSGIDITERLYSGSQKFHKSVREIIDVIRDLKRQPYEKLFPRIFEMYQNIQTEIIENGNRENKEEAYAELEQGIEFAKPIIDMAKDYPALDKFVEAITLDQTSEKDENGNYVSISTIHSAKGLEYETVFILDLSDYNYSRHSDNEEEDNEDLRVLYVALTRARNKMHLLLNSEAPSYATVEQRLTHHLDYQDVLDTLVVQDRYGVIKKQYRPSYQRYTGWSGVRRQSNYDQNSYSYNALKRYAT